MSVLAGRCGGVRSAARLLRPQAAPEDFLAEVIFCAMFVHPELPESVVSNRSHSQSVASLLQDLGVAHCSSARICAKSSQVLANPLKTLKTAMGRSCNKLAWMTGRRPVRLASAPHLKIQPDRIRVEGDQAGRTAKRPG
jgi:hypothetical protein